MYSENQRVWLGILDNQILIKIPGLDFENSIVLSKSELKWIYEELVRHEHETLEKAKQDLRKAHE